MTNLNSYDIINIKGLGKQMSDFLIDEFHKMGLFFKEEGKRLRFYSQSIASELSEDKPYFESVLTEKDLGRQMIRKIAVDENKYYII